MLNSLEVKQYGGDIRTVRRILGIKVKKSVMRRADFVRFDKKKTSTSQSGNKHVVTYSVSAVDRNGRKLVMGEGFHGAGQAGAAAEFIGQTFDLREQTAAGIPEAPIEDYDFLAAD